MIAPRAGVGVRSPRPTVVTVRRANHDPRLLVGYCCRSSTCSRIRPSTGITDVNPAMIGAPLPAESDSTSSKRAVKETSRTDRSRPARPRTQDS